MICTKNLKFSSHPRAKVRHQGPPGSARAQPCVYTQFKIWVISYNSIYVNKQTWKWINKNKTKKEYKKKTPTGPLIKETLNSYYRLKKITFGTQCWLFFGSAKFNFVWLKRLPSSPICLYKEVHMFCLFTWLYQKTFKQKGTKYLHKKIPRLCNISHSLLAGT